MAVQLGEAFGQDRLGAPLRQHQGVRVQRGQGAEVEASKDSLTVPDGEDRDDVALRDQPAGDVQIVKDLKGAGVDDRGPRGVRALGDFVEHEDVEIGGPQGAGQGQAGGAGADDDHVGVLGEGHGYFPLR